MRRSLLACLAALIFLLPTAFCADAPKPASTPDRAYIDSVLDGLVKSGVLTTDQATQMKSDASSSADAVARALAAVPRKKSWTDTVSVGGYTQGQFSYYADAPNADHKTGTASNEFLVRRARIVIKASPTDRAHFGFEGDFGKGAATVVQADLTYDLTEDKTWRADLGQQYVPFGFEVPQSSSVRLPLEFSFLGNLEFPGQHDTGLVLYYTSPQDRPLFAGSKANQWGAGDFGNLALGVFNGQGTSIAEANSQKGFVLRVAKPFAIGDGGYAELGASYWDNTYVSAKLPTAAASVQDRVWGVHGYLAPRPIGFQAEYASGKTEGADVTGWYGMALWHPCPRDVFFLRYNNYDGLKKGGGTTPFTRHGTSLGIAHDLDAATRLTLEYDWESVDALDLTHPAYHNDQLGLRLMVKY